MIPDHLNESPASKLAADCHPDWLAVVVEVLNLNCSTLIPGPAWGQLGRVGACLEHIAQLARVDSMQDEGSNVIG